jgi:cytidine deaminase
MSLNPFAADPSIRDRNAILAATIGAKIAADVEMLLATRRRYAADNLGSVVLQAEADRLVAAYGLSGIEELMLLTLPVAQKIALPPVSKFFVGAVGLERETGNLVLGGNVEFTGAHLGFTIHGESFVFTRAFSRGTSIQTIAIGEAHPCAHCRQYLSEFAATGELMLIDPLGHRLTMAQLYPWPFDPDYLGQAGVMTGGVPRPELTMGDSELPAGVAQRLLDAGRRAHAPYSKCPGAVVLTLKDGAVIAGSSIESVAFNPSMGPLQAAVIDLLAHGYGYDDIAAAALGTTTGGAVDYSRSVAELLERVAPEAPLTIVRWA